MPKRALTATSVEAMKAPKGKQVEMFDRGYPGLSLRLSYGGSKSFSYLYRVGGKLRRMTLGIYPAMSLKQARDAWREAKSQLANGKDPYGVIAPRGSATSFAEVAEEWLRRDQAKNKTAATVERIVRRELMPAWGNRSINAITYDDVMRLIDNIHDRGAVIQSRRVGSYLHRLFVWAIKRRIITSNPMSGMPMPGKEVRRDRALSDSELVSVWSGCNQLGLPFGPVHQLLILTGARRDEIGSLRWDEIDGDTIRLKGERTKNSKPHDIPISTAAHAILDQVPRIEGCDHVFSYDGSKPVSGWSDAKEKLDALVKIEPWRVHDLRRTVATGLQKLGVGLQVIESVLGHVGGSRSGIVATYQRHTFANEARIALELWGQHVATLIEGGERKIVPMVRATAS